MKQTHHTNGRHTTANIATILAILLLTAACRTSTTPSVQTEAPPTTTVTAPSQTPTSQSIEPIPTAYPSPTPVASVNFASADLLEPKLPDGWTAELLNGETFAAALEGVGGDDHAAYKTRVQSASGPETVVLRAFADETSHDGTKPAQLLITILPRHGLKLDKYVAQVTEALIEVEGVSVERAGIVYDIGNDGRPVGIVQYRIHAGDDSTEIGGYQVAQFDAEAANLNVLTFTTAASKLAEEIPEFNDIAASVGAGSELVR